MRAAATSASTWRKAASSLFAWPTTAWALAGTTWAWPWPGMPPARSRASRTWSRWPAWASAARPWPVSPRWHGSHSPAGPPARPTPFASLPRMGRSRRSNRPPWRAARWWRCATCSSTPRRDASFSRPPPPNTPTARRRCAGRRWPGRARASSCATMAGWSGAMPPRPGTRGRWPCWGTNSRAPRAQWMSQPASCTSTAWPGCPPTAVRDAMPSICSSTAGTCATNCSAMRCARPTATCCTTSGIPPMCCSWSCRPSRWT